MVNRCWKHSPLSRSILRALLHPSIDSKTARGSSPYAKICILVAVNLGLKASALLLNLNVLMLYDNMEQLKKLRVWHGLNVVLNFLIKSIKMPQNPPNILKFI